jgi:hypothetical protein
LPAAVGGDGAARDRTAMQEIADLLRSNLPKDAFDRFCELVEISAQNGAMCDRCWLVDHSRP